jgi:hypothetical protein
MGRVGTESVTFRLTRLWQTQRPRPSPGDTGSNLAVVVARIRAFLATALPGTPTI